MMGAALIAAALSGEGSPPTAIGTPVAQGVGGNGSSATTFTITTLSDIPADSHLIVPLSSSNANIASAISDSVNGTTGWALTSAVNPSGASATFKAAYLKVASTLPAGTVITVTHPLTSGNKAGAAFSVSGLDLTNPIDLALAGASATSINPSYTSAAFNSANVLAIGIVWRSGATGDSYDDQAPFTNLSTASAAPGSADMHVDYSIRSATTAVTIAPVIGASRLWAALIIGFKGA